MDYVGDSNNLNSDGTQGQILLEGEFVHPEDFYSTGVANNLRLRISDLLRCSSTLRIPSSSK